MEKAFTDRLVGQQRIQKRKKTGPRYPSPKKNSCILETPTIFLVPPSASLASAISELVSRSRTDRNPELGKRLLRPESVARGPEATTTRGGAFSYALSALLQAGKHLAGASEI